MIANDHFGIRQKLIAARKENGMTVAQLARKMRIKSGDVSRIESGYTSPTLEYVNEVSRVLGYRMTTNIKKKDDQI